MINNADYDEYNMSLSWKEIDSIKFPDTEIIKLEEVIIEDIEKDSIERLIF